MTKDKCRHIFAVCPAKGYGQCPACQRQDRIAELEAQVDRLEKANDEANDSADYWEEQAVASASLAATLKAEVERLKKDVEFNQRHAQHCDTQSLKWMRERDELEAQVAEQELAGRVLLAKYRELEKEGRR